MRVLRAAIAVTTAVLGIAACSGSTAQAPAASPPTVDRTHAAPATVLPSGADVFPHRDVIGPTLSLSPTSGPYGTLVRVTGTVAGVRDCPAVTVRAAADGATGAASGVTDAVVALDPSGEDHGTYATTLRIPDTRLTGRAGPPVIRASCERLDHHATNVGDEPQVEFTVTG